jgi:hypothetical protein
MLEVQPSHELGDTFDFQPNTIREHISRGYVDMLMVLRNKGRMDDVEYRELINGSV